VFDSELFQRSPTRNKRRRDDNVRQTDSIQELEEGEADADDDTDLDFDMSVGRGQASASTALATSNGASSTTPSAPQKIKRTKGRQSGQKIVYDRRLTKEKDIILANVCIARSSKYGIESMRRFWSKIRGKFESAIGRKYAGVSRHMDDLVIKRKANIKASHKSGHAARDDDYTQTIDGWIPTVQTHQKSKSKKSSSRKKKLKVDAKHERRRDRLSQRLKDKPDYEPSFSFFSSAFASGSNSESFENQTDSGNSSSSTISSEARENADDNAEASEVADLVTGTSSSPNSDTEMRGALNNDDFMFETF